MRKKSWQIIKMIINKRKYTPAISKFKCKDSVIEDGKLISDKFNIFFVNVGPTLAKKIEHSSKCPTHFISYDAVHRFYLEPVTENELLKIISNFSDSSAGGDDLKLSMIKKIKHHIAIPLTHICNLSFNTGVFPSELKVANVVPIFKSGDEMLFSNYRPVSVLPVFSKIYERLMYNRLIQFINDNNLLYNFQFGFQKGKSTHMALIILLDKISEALDKGEYVIGVFF